MVTIKGSYVGNRRDAAEAIEFYRRGVISIPFKVSPKSSPLHFQVLTSSTDCRLVSVGRCVRDYG